MSERILLDTDIGSDIDDAVCLAYLLAQPECELLGITTVSGEPVARAAMASALCRVAGKEVPIFPGTENPLIGPQKQPRAPQAAALSRWPHQATFPHGEAVEFLRRTIRAHPGEVTLLTIGPLTNIGLLFAVDPEIPGLLKQLVMMGGIYLNPANRIEWNTVCDPHASAIVFRAPVRRLRAVGLDVTMRVQMLATEVRERFQVPLLRPVLDFAEVWFQQRDHITFHDPLAATTIFSDAICAFERGEVMLDLDETPGATCYSPALEGRHEIAADVSKARFFEHYFGTFEST